MLLLFISCIPKTEKYTSKEVIPLKKTMKPINLNLINGHSFIELTKKDSLYIFYKPCDASILKYKVTDSVLTIRTHQDGTFNCKIKSKKVINDSTVNINYKYFEFSPLLELLIVKRNEYWIINEHLFIDSLYSKKIPYIKQTCDGFFN